jgi:hypothetical protein
MTSCTEIPRVLSLIPGRVRFHLPDGAADDPRRVEAELRRLPGVRDVRADARTGNVLVHFDPRQTSATELLSAAGRLAPEPPPRDPDAGLNHAGAGAAGRAVVRGLVGHALVDTAIYAVTFSQPFGLPLAPLGALHLGLDVLVWTAALAPLLPAAGCR